MTTFIDLLEWNHLKTQSENTACWAGHVKEWMTRDYQTRSFLGIWPEEKKVQENLRRLCTGNHTLRLSDRKIEKSKHLAEINLVPNLTSVIIYLVINLIIILFYILFI